jgi:hypothetical protein
MSGIKYEKGDIKLDLAYVFEAMSAEDKLDFIHAISLEKSVIENVCDHLAGDDKNGCWSGYDDEWRMRALRKIENNQLKNWSRYNWKVFEEATHRLKEIKEKEHIYWALHHGPFREPEMWEIWERFRKQHGITSEYTTKKADADIDRVEGIIKEALLKLVEDQPMDLLQRLKEAGRG